MDKALGTLDGTLPVTNIPCTIWPQHQNCLSSNALMHLPSGESQTGRPVQLPELEDDALGTRTVREVLTHQAGLKSWIPFYIHALQDSTGVFGEEPSSGCSIEITPSLYLEEAYADTVWNCILQSELNPPGHYRYSDLGYYLWHKVLENQGMGIDTWVEEHLAAPLGWTSFGFNPLERGIPLQDIAPTVLDMVFRKGIVHGTVHDPGAAMQGGVGCHAGLFSNAYDLAELGETWLRGGTRRGIEVAPQDELREWTQRGYPNGDNRRGLAFDKPALQSNSGPTCDLVSWSSFGHSGFTGTLLWIDPEYDLVYVFSAIEPIQTRTTKSFLSWIPEPKFRELYGSMSEPAVVSQTPHDA